MFSISSPDELLVFKNIEMHTVQNYKLSKTKQVYWCDKEGHTAMPLMILKWKNRLEKCVEFAYEFTKMACRICGLLMQNFRFFLAQNSDNPSFCAR